MILGFMTFGVLSISEAVEILAWALGLRLWEFVVVACGTLLALGLLNAIAPRLELIDHPDSLRKRHARPIPLTGGLALLCGVWVGAALTGLEQGEKAAEILALLGIVAAVHAFDDHSGLSARQRIVIDAVLALAFVVITGHTIEALGGVADVEFRLGPLAVPFTIFVYLTLTNAYNMIDGLDGLALTQFLISLIAIGLFHLAYAQGSGFAPHAAAVTVASLVVLLANLGWFGAFLKCLLGDSGARFLGFFLVYVLIVEGQRILPPLGGVYFVALPLLDLCAVVGARLRAGVGPMQPDRRHLHHLLVDAGLGPARTVMVMALLSTGFIGLFLVLRLLGAGNLTLGAVFVALACLYWQQRLALAGAVARSLAARRRIEPAE